MVFHFLLSDVEQRFLNCQCHNSFLNTQVCSNNNETYGSDCAVHQLRCFCEEGIENNNCRNPEKYKHTHIEYFGKIRYFHMFLLE